MQMRGCDLNADGAVWQYRPASHKTEHHGRDRIIMLGPPSQAIIRQFLKTDPAAYLFSPADALEEKRVQRRAGELTRRKRAEPPTRAAMVD